MSPPILDPIRGALLRSQPDSKLVAMVREGRERAFEEIVRRYRGPLVGFAAMIVPADRADDVVQESLIAAYGSLESSDAEIVLRPWLFKIVRNRALNHLRDTPAAEELTEELDAASGPDEIAEQHEQVAALVGGLQALPDAQREAILARELEGRGHAEIAAELGTSPGAVRQLIFRARGALRQAAGLLVPLPLLRLLLGPGGADAGATAAAGAGLGAAAAAGGAATGIGTKIAVGVAGVAIAVGGGIAFERGKGGDDPSERSKGDDQAFAAEGSGAGEGSGSQGDDRSGSRDPSGAQGPSGRSGHGGGDGDDRGGDGEDEDDSSSHGGGSSGHGGDGGDSDDSSGHGSGDDDFDDLDDDSSGPGGGDDDDEDLDDLDDSSGSGSSSSGSSSLDSSGSGSGDDLEPAEVEVDDDSSGSGSGSESSGSDDDD